MVNTSVKIGKLTLRNPVMTGSGTFGFGSEMSEALDLSALGACVVKSTSREPRLGNPTPRIIETSSGILNAIGLQNGGIDNFIEEKLPFLRQYDVPIIVNLVGYEVADYVYLAERLTEAGGVHALEINISCPNVKHGCDFAVDPKLTFELITALRKATDLTLITKLSPNVTDVVSVGRAAADAGSDALSLINTLLGTAIDIRKRKFRLANVTGGLSGPAIKPIALRMVWQVHQALPNIPLVGMGGIVTANDAIEFLLAGATAVAVGTATFINPTAAIDVANGIEKFLAEQGIDDVNELIGAVTR
ncbi:dihydroorotate dehydrogenase B (NAD(+)), catalytic subunit [Capsulimonas corticalis]|uniref:Dihydroorotate dehydrogenase n=1 Tax=Capsulimonas corticalis TaxID=2219043 RepID=A0A402D3P4_9BACT|nr:dihydroorotate dehydrogenase [Capsulimonas corticalis]BDI31868.1 dihydroorotate dehydrogenase B (NAD(+)), catalytic subunit [Capsulimonas corticalis]